jgi:Domain of Unknown Function (DUF1080).
MKRNLAALLILGIFCFPSCVERETKLFNGKNLDGWTIHLAPDSGDVLESLVFCAKEGLINISGQPFGYMITDKSFKDYKLHLEWRWYGEPSNSGIFLHAEPIDGVWPRCAEVNLMNGRAGDMIASGGSSFEELAEGRFLRSTKESAEHPAGEWNTAEIVCKGNFIQAYINGVLMNEAHFDRSEGPIALQSEGGPLEIRNVYLTPLKD